MSQLANQNKPAHLSKSGSLKIGPFTTAGIFHIYCTIHRGMNLTIVVQ